VNCAKKGGLILTFYASYDVFLRKELPFGVAIIATALKTLVVLIFSEREREFTFAICYRLSVSKAHAPYSGN